ncbi:bidirectional sugar transporter NEC1-like [Rutidosis leptorrhynchoides]|uniref:bidirectional sugar transporter NEC1-like n=1 Tax=Rutidosis leptorrhynchoides TaxID=125765 RepID=UPI003A996BA2
MVAFMNAHILAFVFGLLGNIISFLVFLAPMPTFYKIYRKKSSEGYHAIPYMVALFSAALLLYYAFLKTNAYMIVSINGFGCFIEISYLSLYIFYAPKSSKISTITFISIFNIGGLGIVMLLSLLLAKGRQQRVELVGWICAVINLAVFAAPLSIMRRVIRTKSVEYMPFMLSFFLTLCATTWFFYGFFVNDYFIAVPNIAGFLFGIAQMTLYCVYKDSNKKNRLDQTEKPNRKSQDQVQEDHIELEEVVCEAHDHDQTLQNN